MITFKYPAHIFFGFLFGIVGGYYLKLEVKTLQQFTSFYPALIIGAIFPDIDIKGSLISRILWPIAWIFRMLFKHREFTHSLLAIILIAWLALSYWDHNSLFFMGVLIGYISHLFADSLTKEGIALLYPISRKKFKLLPFI